MLYPQQIPVSRMIAGFLVCLSLGLSNSSCAVLQRLRPSGGESGGFSPDQVQTFPVSLKTLEAEPLKDTSLFIGTLEASQRVVLKPETEGRVTQIFTQAGDRLKPGDEILRLSPNRSEAAMSAAKATVAAARASKNSAQAQWRSSQARVAELNADMALQNAEFERISSLVAEGALSQQSLDQVIRDRDAAKAALNSARQQVIANEAVIRETEASLDQADAQVQSVEEDLKDTTLKAPIAGIVADLAVKQGDYVEAGDTLTTITDNRSLEIDLPIPVEYRDRLRLGLTVELRNYATEAVMAKGTIGFISPTVDATTQSILAKAKIQNPDGILRDAQQVEARIVWSENPGVLVPTEAIVRFGGQTFVFVAQTKDGKTIAEQRVVELGNLQGNAYQILTGLSAGEAIVISGMLNLADGVTIVSQP